MALLDEIIYIIAVGIEVLGVLTITVGLIFAAYRFATSGRHVPDPIRRLRQDLGQGILLGLEFLVAGDIIRTVAVTPTLESVSVLGIIVIIRIALSMSLEIELEGQLPWRRRILDMQAKARTE